MRKSLVFMTFAFLVGSTAPVFAQNNEEQITEENEPGKNMIKINILSLPLKNFSLQYERAVAKKITVGLGVRYMPEGKLPLMTIAKSFAESNDPNDNFSDQIANIGLGNFALTPEVRFYMGKEAFRGFYIAPFARYATFKMSLPFDLETEDANNQVTTERIDLKGDLNTIAGGILFGAQWKLGKMVYLDWQILGPHFGKATGNLAGKKNLTAEEQADLQDMIDDLDDIPFIKFTSNINSSGAEVKVNGPWAGIRSGLSIGIRF